MVGKFTKIRLILTAVLAFITAAVLSFAVFAATNVRLTGSGGLEYEASGEQPPDPVTPPKTPEEEKVQYDRLTDSGFAVEEGKIDQLQPSQGSLWDPDKTPKDMNYALRAVKEENGQLVPTGEKPILSFAIYDGAVCDYVNELVIILDFSSFYITSFGSYFMDGLAYAICGLSKNINPDKAFAYSVDVPVYDAITGAKKEQDGSPVTKTVAFNGEGFEIEGESVADYSGFSLRLVLPNVKSENGEALTVTFAESSLNVSNWQQNLGFYPGNISIDLSFMDLDREGGASIEGIEINSNATGHQGAPGSPTVTHFHFIGKTENQLEYAFNNAIEYVGGNNAPEDYTTEIFVKESLSSPFTRLYTRVLKNAGKAEIVVVDSAATDGQSDRDILAILELCYWLKYEKGVQDIDGKYLISHQRRLSDNKLDGERAQVSVSWDDTELIDGKAAHAVVCAHQPGSAGEGGLIGYFTADRTFFGADGLPISR